MHIYIYPVYALIHIHIQPTSVAPLMKLLLKNHSGKMSIDQQWEALKATR